MVQTILPKPRKGEVACWLFTADGHVASGFNVARRLGYNLWADQLSFGRAFGEWNNPIDRLWMGLPGKIWHQITRHLPHIRWLAVK